MVLLGLLLNPSPDFQRIRVVATSDLHCRVLPSADFSAPGLPFRELGGWDNLARLIDQSRTDASLLLDCGGFAFGSPESRATQGRDAVRFMNLCKYDAAAIGASDFFGSAENLEILAKSATFPLLADPMLDVVLNRRSPLFRPFAVRDVKGVKVAIIGLSDTRVQEVTRKVDNRGFAPDEPLLQIRRYLTAVNAEAPDLVVAIGHLLPDEGAMLLDSFPDLDLVVCPAGPGLSPERLVKVGSDGREIAVVDILYDRAAGNVYQVESRRLNVIAGTPDSAAARLCEEITVPGMDSVVCFSPAVLTPDDSFGTLAATACEALRRETEADLAILPWNAVETGLVEGWLTRRALFNAVPFCEPVRTTAMDDTTLHRFIAGFEPAQPFPMLAGADLFVVGDTGIWPASAQVARIRHRNRKTKYRVATTEVLLERGGLSNLGRLSEKNLSDLWTDWTSAQDTLVPVSRPRLYPATAGLITKSDSACFPVDINAADSELLEKLPGIGPRTAERIIEYRQAHGRFGSVEELLNVKGIGPKKLDQIRPLATTR